MIFYTEKEITKEYKAQVNSFLLCPYPFLGCVAKHKGMCRENQAVLVLVLVLESMTHKSTYVWSSRFEPANLQLRCLSTDWSKWSSTFRTKKIINHFYNFHNILGIAGRTYSLSTDWSKWSSIFRTKKIINHFYNFHNILGTGK